MIKTAILLFLLYSYRNKFLFLTKLLLRASIFSAKQGAPSRSALDSDSITYHPSSPGALLKKEPALRLHAGASAPDLFVLIPARVSPSLRRKAPRAEALCLWRGTYRRLASLVGLTLLRRSESLRSLLSHFPFRLKPGKIRRSLRRKAPRAEALCLWRGTYQRLASLVGLGLPKTLQSLGFLGMGARL